MFFSTKRAASPLYRETLFFCPLILSSEFCVLSSFFYGFRAFVVRPFFDNWMCLCSTRLRPFGVHDLSWLCMKNKKICENLWNLCLNFFFKSFIWMNLKQNQHLLIGFLWHTLDILLMTSGVLLNIFWCPLMRADARWWHLVTVEFYPQVADAPCYN